MDEIKSDVRMAALYVEAQKRMLFPVILCGGAGTRLWPASRDGFPKPFITLPDGDSLIAKTIRRARHVAPGVPLLFVSGQDHGFLIRNALRMMDDTLPATILKEPMGRNTAPAIAVAALWAQQHGGDTAQLLVLAADHLIHDQLAFEQAVHDATLAAAKGALVTFGIVPTRPETGYGYLEQGERTDDRVFQVKRFVEKPALEAAERYVQSGDFAWNSGMFCFGVGTLLAALKQHAPDIMHAAELTWAATDHAGTDITLDRETFSVSPAISIDYAVMEKASNVNMVRAGFDWSDIGAWTSMAEMGKGDAAGNRMPANAIAVDTFNTFVQSGRTVATIGIENLLIVDTPDALLLADRSRAQDVKRVVESLKAKNSPLTKLHTTVHRPWGTYTILEDEADCKVKRIVVYPGASLSLQSHHKRSEHWVVVTGVATVTNGDQILTLHAGDATFIPVETKHRLENKTSETVAIIETQVGTYFGEDDIVRYEDRYGRT
jgi:mannose-1-phosphate guanylyltransferase / mannose-6-phosphate isomerase